MFCPNCKQDNDRVLDSRPSDYGIRRRRECISCEERWTTYEVTEDKLKVSKDHIQTVKIKKILIGIQDEIGKFLEGIG